MAIIGDVLTRYILLIQDEFPFAKIPQEDVVKFKHAILEVKLQTLAGNANPAWVDELVKSHLVEEVPKFSKFIHGVCSLLESRVSLLPFWLPQMDKDIRKPPPPGYVSQLTGVKNTTHSDIDETVSRMAKRSQRDFREDQRDRDQVQIQIDHDNQSSLGERQPLLDGHTDEDYDSPTESNTFRHRSSRQFLGRIGRFFANEPRTTPRQPQKRIALPVRIEPKVFFANERTFLSWLHFCIVLGGLALGLLNFGDKVGMISGVLFTLVAMMFMLYALWLYQWRAHKIRNRDAGPYDDRVGPTVLVVVLFFAVMINFYLKFTAE